MLSTKGRYAIRVMLDLAEQAANDNDGFIPLKDIAERQDISKKYLEIIVKELVVAELVDSASGKGGGYKLNRPAEKYTIGQIIETMEGPLAPVAALLIRSINVKGRAVARLSLSGLSMINSRTIFSIQKNLLICFKRLHVFYCIYDHGKCDQ